MNMRVCKLFLTIIALYALVVSCKDYSSLNEEPLSSEKVTMNVKDFNDYDETSLTRTVLTPNVGGTSFSWKEDDVVGVYSSERGLTNFFIDASSISPNGQTANFCGSGFALSPNVEYYAFYPYSAASLDKTKIAIDYLGQNGVLENLGSFDYMFSQGSTSSEGEVSFDFEHLGCVVDLNLKAPKSAIYKKVVLSIADGHTSLIKKLYYNVITSSSEVDETADAFSVSLSEEAGYMKEDSTTHIYVMLAPQNLSGKVIDIDLIDSNGYCYKASCLGKNMKAGYTYHYYVNNDGSSNWTFTGIANDLPDGDYSMVSTLNLGKRCEDLIVDGNTVYTVGKFGVRKIDYSDEKSPQIVGERQYSDKRYRSIAMSGQYLYIGMRQNSAGSIENILPDLQLTFETNSKAFSTNLSNNAVFNSFFQKLSISSTNIQDISHAYLYKAYNKSQGVYRNAILIYFSDGKNVSFLGKDYKTREEALAALEGTYRTSNGNECSVNWESLPEGANTLRNLQVFNQGMFDSYRKSGNAVIDETGNPCPNSGLYSARLQVANNTGKDYALLTKHVGSDIESGEISLWVKTACLANSTLEIPLMSNGEGNVLSLSLSPNNGNYNPGIVVKGIVSQSNYILNNDVWYNVKIRKEKNSVSLFIRSKECGTWDCVIDNVKTNSFLFDNLTVGLQTSASNALVYIDDFYYHHSDIDEVANVNGDILILNKDDLSLVNTYHLALKATEIGVNGNIMVVNMLKGFNIYNIENKEKPILVYSYRYPTYTECQGVDFFECSGKKYAFICNYTSGYTIVDITNVDNIRIAHREVAPVTYNDISLKGTSYNFDVVVNYPYAYLTHCTSGPYINTEKDYRGVLAVDLTNISQPTQKLIIASKSDLYDKAFGDHCPIYIDKFNNHLLIDNGQKGVLVFDIYPDGMPVYSGPAMNRINTNVGKIKTTQDGRIFVSDDASPYNLNLYRQY